MANLRRVPYTKPIPEGVAFVTHKGTPHVRYKDRLGKPVLAPLTEDGRRMRLLSRKWYGEYTDADGCSQCVPLSTDKTAAQQMLTELVRKAELGKAGIVDPFERHRRRPLVDHLAEWETSLRASGASAKYVSQTVACARRVVKGCRFALMNDLSASRVQQYLADLRERRRTLPPLDPAKVTYAKVELAQLLGVKPPAILALVRRHRLEATGKGKARRYPKTTAEALRSLRTRGRSIKTSNLYLDAIKQFTAWLVQDRRLPDNPLAHLSGGNVKLDRRHDRQTLMADQLCRVIQSAGQSARKFRGLTGTDRAMLYSVACASGFRASELASLHPDDFTLDDEPPTVTLAAEYAKNGKTAVQPLPPDMVEIVRGYLASRQADQPIWPGTWPKKAAEMISLDLEAVGIPYVVEGTDGPLYADFHALRHSFIALLDKSGATLKEAMQLARHSDPKLTMAVYGRAQLHDLGQAVSRLPSLRSAPVTESAALAATGTNGRSDDSFRPACATVDGSCASVSSVEHSSMGESREGQSKKPLVLQGVESDCDQLRLIEESSPNVTLFELLSRESRALLFSNAMLLLALRRFGCRSRKEFESRPGSKRNPLRTRALALSVNWMVEKFCEKTVRRSG
jgi:integrase